MSRSLDLDAPLLGGPLGGSPLGVRRARRARRSLRWRMAAAPLVAALVVGAGAVGVARSPIARPAARPAGDASGPTAALRPAAPDPADPAAPDPADPGAADPADPAAPDPAAPDPAAADPAAPDPAAPAAGAPGSEAAAGPPGVVEEFPPQRPAPEAEDGAGPSDAELLAVATDAVEAWGRFASTGDLSQVADHYVADGPQFQQFTSEAPALQAEAGGPPYRFTLGDAAVLGDQPAGDRLVRGTLELTREGQPPQRYRWDLRLRRIADGSWRVWTVLEPSE